MNSSKVNSDPRSLTSRPSRSVATSVVAVMLIVVGGLGVWLLGARAFTGDWPPQSAQVIQNVAATTVGSTTVLVVAIILAFMGIVLLVAALWPGQPRRVAIAADDIPGQTAVSRGDLAKLVQRRVEQVDGVASVAVAATRRHTNVRVGSVLGDTTDVRDAVTRTAENVLTQLNPANRIRVRVRIRRTQ